MKNLSLLWSGDNILIKNEIGGKIHIVPSVAFLCVDKVKVNDLLLRFCLFGSLEFHG